MLTIEVTAQDIETARDCEFTLPRAQHCPIALAAARLFDSASTVTYERLILSDEHSSDEHSYGLPPEAQRFIRAFDERLPVKPFCFHVHKD